MGRKHHDTQNEQFLENLERLTAQNKELRLEVLRLKKQLQGRDKQIKESSAHSKVNNFEIPVPRVTKESKNKKEPVVTGTCLKCGGVSIQIDYNKLQEEWAFDRCTVLECKHRSVGYKKI